MSPHWRGKSLSWYVRWSSTNWIWLGSPPHTVLALEPNSWRRTGFSNTLGALRGCGDTHKLLAECLSVGVFPGDREGCLTVAERCRREGSDCCLCVCTKQQCRLPSLLGVSGWCPGEGVTWAFHCSSGGLQCPCWQ